MMRSGLEVGGTQIQTAFGDGAIRTGDLAVFSEP